MKPTPLSLPEFKLYLQDYFLKKQLVSRPIIMKFQLLI